MTPVTDDPQDPRLSRGVDSTPVPQAEAYLVLSAEERAKGFVRPLRRSYQHVGITPTYPLRELTAEERERYSSFGYVRVEDYPAERAPLSGRFWTQAQLDHRACQGTTTMGLALCETYARNPAFYGATYCSVCGMHRPVAEFIWTEDGARVGS